MIRAGPGSALAGLLLGVSLVAPSPTAAQSNAIVDTLAMVDTLASFGRIHQARALLEAWMAAHPDPEPDRGMRARWHHARLALDPRIAEERYLLVAADDSAGVYAPRALLRLALFAEARGEVEAARGYLDRVVRDHPMSPARLDAVARLRGLAAARTEGRGVEGSASGPPSHATHAVQVGVFAEAASADDLVSTLRRAGVDARLVRVRDSELVRVRAGYFPDAEGAGLLLRRLAELGFAGAVVANVKEEVPIG